MHMYAVDHHNNYIFPTILPGDLVIVLLTVQSSKDQRLVYSGKLLLDHFTLKDVLRKVSSQRLGAYIDVFPRSDEDTF